MDFLKKLSIQEINPGAFIGYSWQSDIHTERLISYNPANGQKIAEVATCTAADYEKMILKAQQSYLIWRDIPAPKRGEIIRQIGEALRDYKDDLGSLVSLEMGKSKQEGDGEVQEMIDIADFAVGQSRMLYGKTMHSERPYHRMYEQWHPYGVVGVISAFNFPVAVWAWNAFISAICGNITLWKPSSKTPLCAIAVHHICNEILKKCDAPDIFSLLIPSDHAVMNQFVEDKRMPLISFTGSTHVGRVVAAKIATRLGSSILELGGNNAIILDETAKLDLAIPSIVFGAVGTAGQRCTSTRRLFIHHSIYEEVKNKLIHAYTQISIGDPLNPKNLMGPLIDEGAVSQFLQAIDEIKKMSGDILFGGKQIPMPGFYVEPTLVAGLQHNNKMVHTETFAPILYIMPYQTLEEAIQWQNEVPQGLSSALFTENLKNAELFLSAKGSDCALPI